MPTFHRRARGFPPVPQPLPARNTIDRVKRGGFARVGEVEPDLGPPAVLNVPKNHESKGKEKHRSFRTQRFRHHSVTQENSFRGLVQLTQRIVGTSYEHWLWIRIFEQSQKSIRQPMCRISSLQVYGYKKEAYGWEVSYLREWKGYRIGRLIQSPRDLSGTCANCGNLVGMTPSFQGAQFTFTFR